MACNHKNKQNCNYQVLSQEKLGKRDPNHRKFWAMGVGEPLRRNGRSRIVGASMSTENSISIHKTAFGLSWLNRQKQLVAECKSISAICVIDCIWNPVFFIVYTVKNESPSKTVISLIN